GQSLSYTISLHDALPIFSAPNKFFPFIPLLVVIVVNFAVTFFIFPALDWSSLEAERFGGITLEDRASIWAVLLALIAAVVSILRSEEHTSELQSRFDLVC